MCAKIAMRNWGEKTFEQNYLKLNNCEIKHALTCDVYTSATKAADKNLLQQSFEQQTANAPTELLTDCLHGGSRGCTLEGEEKPANEKIGIYLAAGAKCCGVKACKHDICICIFILSMYAREWCWLSRRCWLTGHTRSSYSQSYHVNGNKASLVRVNGQRVRWHNSSNNNNTPFFFLVFFNIILHLCGCISFEKFFLYSLLSHCFNCNTNKHSCSWQFNTN